MLRQLIKKLNFLNKGKGTQSINSSKPLWRKQAEQIKIDKDLDKNLEFIKENLGESFDIVVRRIEINKRKAAVIFLEGMVKNEIINDDVLKPLMFLYWRVPPSKKLFSKDLLDRVKENISPIGEVREETDYGRLIYYILTGETAILIDGINKVLFVDAKGWEQRAVSEPDIEKVIRGPKDSFTENLRTNATLIRRRIRDPNLRIITTQIGKRSSTDVAVLYIKGIANPDLVEEVKRRLGTIDTDAILESGYIEQFIEDNWWSPFPTVQETERPDKVAASLIEGRVGIIVDNTPFVLLVPTNINMFMVSPEDTYSRWIVGTMARLVRFIANFIALFLPSLYIALTSYHPEMLPTGLALTIASTREGVPFPAFLEAFIMEFALELLREAGARLPGPLGQTIAIVGGLVIGTAAVQAGIVSPFMVIVVAFTAVAAFSVPTFSFGLAVRQTRFVFMILASFLGLYGIMLGVLLLVSHLATLRSFGIGYLEPFAPISPKDLKDVMIRMPLPSMHTRPYSLKPSEVNRLKDRRQNDFQREATNEHYDREKNQ